MLIAIIVLVVVLMSMLGMVLMSRTSMFSKEDMTASAVARRILEECETEPFSTIADTGYVRDYTVGKYNAHVTVTSLDQAGAKVYAAKVMVELTWDAPGTGRGNVALERVISAGGHKNVGEFD
jgi:Tfp pilus assembly protein PilV